MNRWAIELKVLWETQRPKMISLGALGLVFLFMFVRNVITPGLSDAEAAEPSRSSSGEPAKEGSAHADRGPRETVVCPMPPPFERDVFTFNRDHFPLPTPDKPTGEIEPKSAHLPDEDNPVPVEPTREQIEARVRDEASALELRSLIVGARPLAVIEVLRGESKGRHVLEAGEETLGFRIVEVRKGSVVIEKDGVSVELFRTAGE